MRHAPILSRIPGHYASCSHPLFRLSSSKDLDHFLAGVKEVQWKRPEEMGNRKKKPVVLFPSPAHRSAQSDVDN